VEGEIRRVNGRMWQPGESGNPTGRPVGARGRFSQRFVAAQRWPMHLTDEQEYAARSQLKWRRDGGVWLLLYGLDAGHAPAARSSRAPNARSRRSDR
jgi:hypothetical protein